MSTTYKLVNWLSLDKLYITALMSNPSPGTTSIINASFNTLFLDKKIATTAALIQKGKPIDDKSLLPSKIFIRDLFPWKLYFKCECLIDVLTENIDMIIDIYIKKNIETNQLSYDQLWDLSINPSYKAMALLEKYPQIMNWDELCLNTGFKGIQLIMDEYNRNPKSIKLNWSNLSKNSSFIEQLNTLKLINILTHNTLTHNTLTHNTLTLNTLTNVNIDTTYIKNDLFNDEYINYIDWFELSRNHSVAAIELIEFHLNNNTSSVIVTEYQLCWTYLSRNPFAIKLLEKYPNKIDWNGISTNPAAIHIIIPNLHKINMSLLCSNPAAISIIWNEYNKYCDLRNTQEPKLIIKEHISLRTNTHFGYDIECTIDWYQLSTNIHPDVLTILKKEIVHDDILQSYADQLQFTNVSSIIDGIFYKGIDFNVRYDGLSSNPNIFELVLD